SFLPVVAGHLRARASVPDRRSERADVLAYRDRPRHAVVADRDLDQRRLDDEVLRFVPARRRQGKLGLRLVEDPAVADPRAPAVAGGEEYDRAVREAVCDNHLLHEPIPFETPAPGAPDATLYPGELPPAFRNSPARPGNPQKLWITLWKRV